MLSRVAFLFVKDVLGLWYNSYFLFLAAGNSETSKKTKHLDKDEIKKQLLDSMAANNVVEMVEPNERAKKVVKPEDAVDIRKEYEKIIREERKGVIVDAFYLERFSNASRKKRSFKKW